MKKGVVVEKLKRRVFTAEFKIEAVKLVTENVLSYAEVGRIGSKNFARNAGLAILR